MVRETGVVSTFDNFIQRGVYQTPLWRGKGYNVYLGSYDVNLLQYIDIDF